MGWSNQAVIAFLVEVLSGIPGSGLFVYSGNPGPGNPPVFAVVAPGITTDPYGNPVDAVVTVGSAAGAHIQLDQSGDLVAHAASGAEIWLIPSLPAELVYDTSGTLIAVVAGAQGADGAGTTFPKGVAARSGATSVWARMLGAVLEWIATSNAPTGNPYVQGQPAQAGCTLALSSGAGTAAALAAQIILLDSLASGTGAALVFLDTLGTGVTIAADSWHSLGSPSATGFSSDHGRYRMTAEGEVEFEVQLTATGNPSTAGVYTYANTLPAAYRPKSIDKFYPLGAQGTWIAAGARSPGLKVFTTGQVDLHVPSIGGAGTNKVGGTISMPLD